VLAEPRETPGMDESQASRRREPARLVPTEAGASVVEVYVPLLGGAPSALGRGRATRHPYSRGRGFDTLNPRPHQTRKRSVGLGDITRARRVLVRGVG
jgi:hypothetical protein